MGNKQEQDAKWLARGTRTRAASDEIGLATHDGTDGRTKNRRICAARARSPCGSGTRRDFREDLETPIEFWGNGDGAAR